MTTPGEGHEHVWATRQVTREVGGYPCLGKGCNALRQDPDEDQEALREAYDRLLAFTRECAGDGYLNTRGTARMVLREIGESR